MAMIKREDLQIGMRVGRPVRNVQGGILINTETILEEAHLKLLRIWGINDVWVDMPGEVSNRQMILEKVKTALAEMEMVFSRVTGDSMMKLIKAIAQKQIRSELEQSQ